MKPNPTGTHQPPHPHSPPVLILPLPPSSTVSTTSNPSSSTTTTTTTPALAHSSTFHFSQHKLNNTKKCPKNMVQHWKFKPQTPVEITLVKPPNYSRRPRRHSSPSIDNFVHHWKFDPRQTQISANQSEPHNETKEMKQTQPAISSNSSSSPIRNVSEKRHTFFPYNPPDRRQSLPNYLIDKKGRKSLPNIFERQNNSTPPPSTMSFTSASENGSYEFLTPPDFYQKSLTRFALPPLTPEEEKAKSEQLFVVDLADTSDEEQSREDMKQLSNGQPNAMSISYLLSDVNISERKTPKLEQETCPFPVYSLLENGQLHLK